MDVIDLMSIDSASMAPGDWDRISAAITAAVEAGADGVVVTHGTDTIEETALWLELTYTGAVPVVFTGALRRSDVTAPDGPRNVRDALAVATSADAVDLGVVLNFAGQVWQPWGVHKITSVDPQGFKGTQVGSICGDVFKRSATKVRPYVGDLSAARAPRVDIVAAYPGADAVALNACVGAGARGVVLEALGSGNAGAAQIEAVRDACRNGISVVVSTRVRDAHVAPVYAAGRALVDAGAVMLPGLQPAQARVVLLAALAAGWPPNELHSRLEQLAPPPISYCVTTRARGVIGAGDGDGWHNPSTSSHLPS